MPDTTPTLRDRIRRAICEATGFTCLPDELMEPDEYGGHADAVLAVLPEPATRLVLGTTDQQPETADRHRAAWLSARHRATVLSDEITRRAPLLGEYAAQIANLRTMYDVADARTNDLIEERDQLLTERTELIRQRDQIAMDTIKALPAPVDRATVLREAADAVDHVRATMLKPPVRDCYAVGLSGAAGELRRLADEAQQPETRCDVTFIGGGRCEKDAGHRDGRWPNDPHVPGPAADQPDTETEAAK